MGFAITLLMLCQPAGDDIIAIKAGRVITVSGAELKDAIIVLQGRKILTVGTDAAIPDGARIIDASKLVVMPGIVDAGADYGFEGASNEEAGEILPHLRILDAFNPKHPDLARALATGITVAYLGPGNRSVIGGLGAVIKTHGTDLRDLLVREDAALKAAMGSIPSFGNFAPRQSAPTNFYARRPTTRMGVVWEFRKAFSDARKYREEQPARKDDGKDILLRALDRKLHVRVAASRAMDIESAVGLAEEFGLTMILEEAQEAYRHATLLAQKKLPVLLRPNFQTSSIYGAEGSEVRFSTFAVLTAAGVKTALLGAGLGEGESPLAMAALAAKYGATRDQALRGITLTAAEILGIADQVGSIDVGKDADILILSGDPLEATTSVDRVLIGGRIVYGRKLSEY